MSTLIWLLLACSPRDVEVSGTVYAGPALDEPALPGAEIALYGEEGEPHATAAADDQGQFVVDAPRGQTIFATVTADGYATTSFTGQSGTEDTLVISEEEATTASGHTMYGIPLDTLEGWRERFAGCPGLEEGGRVVVGEVRVFDISDSSTNEHPIVTTASVKTASVDGVEREACYLDAAGEAYDPLATKTGDAGFYAVFGVSPGLQTVEITYTAFDSQQIVSYQGVYVDDSEDAVVPRFPTWVQFPF